MSGDIGTPSKPVVFRGQEWRLEVREDDPADPAADERWLRSDLVDADENQLGVLKCGDGTEIPIFETGTAEETVSEAMRVQIGGEIGYLPIAPVEEAQYRSRRVQHNNEIHAYHNAATPGAAIPDSEVNRWPYNDDEDTSTAIDVTGNDDADISGASYTTTRQEGSHALEFDGTDDVLEALDVNEPSEFAMTVWVYPHDLSGAQTIWGRDAIDDSPRNKRIMIDLVDSNTIEFVIFDGSNNKSVSIPSSEVSTNSWHFVGVSYSHSSENAEIYLDGVLKDTSTLEIEDDPDDLPHFTWGASYSTNDQINNYNGILDDPRYWNEYLNESQHENIFQSY